MAILSFERPLNRVRGKVLVELVLLYQRRGISIE